MNSWGKAVRFLAVLCMLGVALIGLAQAVHVHSQNSGAPRHDCSICSAAHSGVLGSVAYRPAPLFVRTIVVFLPAVGRNCSGFVSSLRIRPPPAV